MISLGRIKQMTSNPYKSAQRFLVLAARRRRVFDQFKRILDEDLAGHFAQRRLGDVLVALEDTFLASGE